jgi:hypothetical protein
MAAEALCVWPPESPGPPANAHTKPSTGLLETPLLGRQLLHMLQGNARFELHQQHPRHGIGHAIDFNLTFCALHEASDLLKAPAVGT